jgi:1,4-alpha-glucan branching enzyme
LLDDARHRGIQRLVHDLNAAYRNIPALHRRDDSPEGFRWVIGDDRAQSVFAYLRQGTEGDTPALVICNLTPVPRHGYRIGVPRGGTWHEVLNSDGAAYGGTNSGNGGSINAEPVPNHGFADSLSVFLPPLATLILVPQG